MAKRPPPKSSPSRGEVGTTRNRGLVGVKFGIRRSKMEKWKCKICGYIYDPEKGDPDGDIPPNTPFEKLPDTWVCPACGAPKDMFEKA